MSDRFVMIDDDIWEEPRVAAGFDENEPRDEHGQWVSEGGEQGVVYHGTPRENLERILKEGIKARVPRSGFTHAGITGKVAYVTTSLREAQQFALDRPDTVHGVVFEVHVPPGEPLAQSPESATILARDQDIPPSWIKAVYGRVNARGEFQPLRTRAERARGVKPVPTSWQKIRTLLGLDKIFYLVVELGGDVPKTAAFNPDQPRDDHGRWTDGSPQPELSKHGINDFIGDGSLPRPKILMGDHPGTPRMIGDYLASHGQEFKAQPLPEGYMRGELGMCYMNATHALWQHGQEDDLDYAEGIAYPVGKPGEIGILHAWLVDKAGNVIDPTLPDPEKVTYFGVRYPRRDYLRYITKTKIYGVLGGLNKDGERVLKEGTLEWKGRARRHKS